MEAETLEVQVRDARLKLLGPDHPSTLNAMAELASVYRTQERAKEAEEPEAPVMETRLRILGPDQPSTLATLINNSKAERQTTGGYIDGSLRSLRQGTEPNRSLKGRLK